MIVRADELLQILKDEKWKRGHYTYQTIPQANKDPAEQSILNASFFLKNIKMILDKQSWNYNKPKNYEYKIAKSHTISKNNPLTTHSKIL